MVNLEGPLSKWTNVVNGWQYRWFVLDKNAGLLSYYTSKEKMMRGSRRGCVKLKGAIVGIDDEDDSTFTITSDQKTFHFQARNGDEREKWISGLEETIMRHTQPFRPFNSATPGRGGNFERKLAEADAYLQILIDQVKTVSTKIERCDNESVQQTYIEIKMTAEEMIETIKQSIVQLQICKQNLESPLLDGITLESFISADSTSSRKPVARRRRMQSDAAQETFEDTREYLPMQANAISSQLEGRVPDKSYTSSDDDDFFDAEDRDETRVKSPYPGGDARGDMNVTGDGERNGVTPCVIASENDYYDELYDDMAEDELESLDQHGSIVTHLLSQVRIGMDLTKIVLPTFILERRSLLEMFADFLAHPDLFVSITDGATPRDRMVQCVRWYLSAFHAGRKSEVAKKPYNPLLGETFRCYWDLPTEPKTTELTTEGPVPWATKNNLTMVAEQVSHHPPISAFYAEHHNRRISACGYVWTKSKFLGLSIGVHMIGQTVVSVLDHGEDYVLTFPSAYGRSILTVPWVELGGKTQINCPKTGYSATVQFHTKPFYGGKKNTITAEIFAPDEKKSFCTIQGEWNGAMWAKYNTGRNEKFVDVSAIPIFKKQVKPREEQAEFESRRLWADVTASLKRKNVEEATSAKHKLEQRQRQEAREREEEGLKWETKLFHEVGEHWVFGDTIGKRLEKKKKELELEAQCSARSDVSPTEGNESTEQNDVFDDVAESIPELDVGEIGV